MVTPGPLDITLAVLFSLRRFGLGRTVLGAVAITLGVQPLLPPVACGCFGAMLRRCDRTLPYMAAVRSDLKNLASQQEIYHSDRVAYSSDPAALAFVTSQGVAVEIEATDEAWAAWATHDYLDEDAGCAMYWGALPADPIDGIPGALWEALQDAEPGEMVCVR